MNDPDLPDSNPTQKRQRQLMIIASAVVVCAAVAYFSGGGSEAVEEQKETVQGTQVKSGNAPDSSVHSPNTDELYDDAIPDGETVDISELQEPPTVAASTNPPPVIPPPQPSSGVTAVSETKGTASPATADKEGMAKSQVPTPTILQTEQPKRPDSPSQTGVAQASAAPPKSSIRPTDPEPQSDKPAAENNKVPAVVKEKHDPALQAPALVLTKPARPLPGVVAHTKTVITEADVQGWTQPLTSASATPVSKPQPPAPKARAVKATKAQAESFAKKSTKTWQRDGRIPDSQHFRLPKTTETASPKVWRADDTPTNPTDKKPFGLVLVDTAADNSSPPAIITSPGGIPVRNVPDGESALKKHGPDKPLWRRPE